MRKQVGVDERSEEIPSDDWDRFINVWRNRVDAIVWSCQQYLGGNEECLLSARLYTHFLQFLIGLHSPADLNLVNQAIGGQAVNEQREQSANSADKVEFVLETEIAGDRQLYEARKGETHHVRLQDWDDQRPPMGLILERVRNALEKCHVSGNEAQNACDNFESDKHQDVEQDHVDVDLLRGVEEINLVRVLASFLAVLVVLEQILRVEGILPVAKTEGRPVDWAGHVNDPIQQIDWIRRRLVRSKRPTPLQVPDFVHDVGLVHEEPRLAAVVHSMVLVVPQIVQEDDERHHELGGYSHRSVFQSTRHRLCCPSESLRLV